VSKIGIALAMSASLAADHEAIIPRSGPRCRRTRRRRCIDSLLAQQLCVRPVFGVAGVAAIDHQVALAEFSGKPTIVSLVIGPDGTITHTTRGADSASASAANVGSR